MTDAATARTAGERAEDRHDITQLIYRYCRAMDRMDHELGYSIWHDGATADYGAGIYQGTGRGFIDFVNVSHASFVAHSHQVTNILLDLAGDLAASEAYVTAALRMTEDGRSRQLTVRGRYLDRWSRRDGRWGLDRRVYLHDFDDLRDVTPAGMPECGRRDRDDPSYAALSLQEERT